MFSSICRLAASRHWWNIGRSGGMHSSLQGSFSSVSWPEGTEHFARILSISSPRIVVDAQVSRPDPVTKVLNLDFKKERILELQVDTCIFKRWKDMFLVLQVLGEILRKDNYIFYVHHAHSSSNPGESNIEWKLDRGRPIPIPGRHSFVWERANVSAESRLIRVTSAIGTY